ncbi:8753_t:CDS:2, partial [Dentiscutata erythropus]
GNINYEPNRNYDKWINSNESNKSGIQSNSGRIPDFQATFQLESEEFEFIYGEVSGPPYKPISTKIETDRRKLIRYMKRNKSGQEEKFIKNFRLNIDTKLIDNINIFSILVYEHTIEPFKKIKLNLEANRNVYNTQKVKVNKRPANDPPVYPSPQKTKS